MVFHLKMNEISHEDLADIEYFLGRKMNIIPYEGETIQWVAVTLSALKVFKIIESFPNIRRGHFWIRENGEMKRMKIPWKWSKTKTAFGS